MFLIVNGVVIVVPMKAVLPFKTLTPFTSTSIFLSGAKVILFSSTKCSAKRFLDSLIYIQNQKHAKQSAP